MIKNIKVRLNLDKDEHRKAYEILNYSEKSISQFVIAAVNRYGGYLSGEEEKEQMNQLIEQSSIREEIDTHFVNQMMIDIRKNSLKYKH